MLIYEEGIETLSKINGILCVLYAFLISHICIIFKESDDKQQQQQQHIHTQFIHKMHAIR